MKSLTLLWVGVYLVNSRAAQARRSLMTSGCCHPVAVQGSQDSHADFIAFQVAGGSGSAS
jgi:hypothetical protein